MALQIPNAGDNMMKQELGNSRKVRLKPGKGLMDWIRQSNASRMSRYPLMASVDEVELSRHDRLDDCWILLYDMDLSGWFGPDCSMARRPALGHIFFGPIDLVQAQVYDVTHYLEFHPGGVDEIMRAAGTDSTGLFNEVHRWVNYRSMLKSCVIGPFSGSRQNLRRPLPEGSAV